MQMLLTLLLLVMNGGVGANHFQIGSDSSLGLNGCLIFQIGQEVMYNIVQTTFRDFLRRYNEEERKSEV